MGNVGTLRAQARAVQAQAALASLAPREQSQLAGMPVLLKKHLMRQEMLEGDAPVALRHDMHPMLQAETRVPPNAGLLRTQRLVYPALTALRSASPASLHRLVTRVEALPWLKRAGQARPVCKKPGAGPAVTVPTGSARS